MFRKSLIVTALALCAVPSTVSAQTDDPVQQDDDMLTTRAQDVVDVLRGDQPASTTFSAAFLAQVPESQLTTLAAQMEAQFGALQGVAQVVPINAGSAQITLRFEHATASGPMHLDDQGMVAGLLFNQFTPIDDNAAKILADIAALPGTASVLFAPLDDGVPAIASMDDTAPLAIGSTFKLYVLSALARSIERGEHRWDEVVPLTTRSFPSGQMQDWPVGAPVTLHTLASMMIAISDNTATDQLIAVLGRDAVEAEMRASGHAGPARMQPFLSTLELFALKGDPPARAEYLGRGEAGRRAWLKELDSRTGGDPRKVAPPRFSSPTAIDTVEWFASGQDLRAIMRRIAQLDDPTARAILAIHPSVAAPMRAQWRYVGFKGGSEPGVLNLTWLLQDRDGAWFVLTLGWNNPAHDVDKQALELIAMRILALRREE